MRWIYLRDQVLISGPALLRYAYFRAISSIVKNDLPNFSIVIPCYNNPQFLESTVQSIVSQTIVPGSVVFVNDGSFSVTAEAIARCGIILAQKNINVVIIEQENRGVASARNTGIEAAEGDWIIPLDYDDTIAPRYIERCSAIIRAMPNVQFIYPHSLKTNTSDTYWIPRAGHPRRILSRCLYPAFSAFRKNLWQDVGGYDVSHPLGMGDWDFFIKIIMSGTHCCRLPFFMGTWRGHELNETHTAQRNWECGRAMVVTLSHTWRSRQDVISSLDVIADMDEEVAKRVLKKTQLYPTHPYPYMWLALAYRRHGKIDQALRLAQKAKDLEPSHWLMAHVADMISC
jgi:glycosyltransferase involved in cell wall biosynthesis